MMESDFIKFPSTPHLLWLGRDPLRKEKLLSLTEAQDLLSGPVVIEEKVDGANIGISFDSGGQLLVQNRGNSLEAGTGGQFARLWPWLMQRELAFIDALEDKLILFGDWCYVRHSIHYTRLPDFFLAFDVLDKRERKFMSTSRRDRLVRKLDLATVPLVARGVFRFEAIPSLIGTSSFYDGPMEGIYIRQEDERWLVRRAKVVRSEFVQQITTHWSKQPSVRNRLRQ